MSSDEEWVHNICRLPAPADDDDDAWLRELCHTPIEQTLRGALAGAPTGVDADTGVCAEAGSARGSVDTASVELVQHEPVQHELVQHVPVELEPVHLEPALKQDIIELMASNKHPAIDFSSMAALGTNRGGAYLHSCCFVRERVDELWPCVFKIGITWQPRHRWETREDGGYKWDGFTRMHVLWGAAASECRELEKSLISKFKPVPGCWNVAPGGDGFQANDPRACFVYVVFARSDDISRWRRWKCRRKA